MTEDTHRSDSAIKIALLRRLTATRDDVDLDVWQELIAGLPELTEEVREIFWRRMRCGADESAVIGLVEHILPEYKWEMGTGNPNTALVHNGLPYHVQQAAASPALALAAALVSALMKRRFPSG